MKQEKRIINLLLVYLAYVFFYGLIIKFTHGMGILFSIKTYVPEILLLITTVYCALTTKKCRISSFLLIGLWYFLFLILIGIAYAGISNDTFYLIRDLFIPIFMGIMLARKNFHERTLNEFYSKFLIICMIYLILGAILGSVQYLNGWEWTSKFYANYIFYGTDNYTKVIITEAYGHLRPPGLTGNHVSFSYYALIAMVVLLASQKTSLFWKGLFILCGVTILITTANKTAIVCCGMILLFYVFRKIRGILKYIILGILGGGIILYLLQNLPKDVFLSTFERFNLWKTVNEFVNPIEILIPYNVFAYNPNALGIVSFWDNTYLFLLFTTGIIGLIWICLFCLKLYKSNKRTNLRFMFGQLFLFLILASFFNNITNGRAYFSIYLIINCLYFKSYSTFNKIEEKI